jgi:hypothetical protein
MKKLDSKALEFIYQDTEIHFLIDPDGPIMINATEMSKLFNKQTRYFTRLDSTKDFVRAMLKEKFNRADFSDFDPFSNKKGNIQSDNRADVHEYIKKNLYNTDKKNGTYLCRELALKFSAWLDPDFDLWIIRTIDSILFNENYMVHQKKVIEIQETKNKIEQLKYLIRHKYSDENTAIELLDLQDLLVKLTNEKRSAIAAQVKNIQHSLFDDN